MCLISEQTKRTNYKCEKKLKLTFKPLSRISSALAPRTVQWTAIFSFLLIPKDRTVYLAVKHFLD